MVRKVLSLFLLVSAVIAHSLASPLRNSTQFGKVLYILLDGFRYDYVTNQNETALPGFTKFLENGVRAEFVNPMYPTLSYPSWTTLSTGLYPENHDIIGNYFYDPEDGTKFSMYDDEATAMKKWWHADPIWTAEAVVKATLNPLGRCDVPDDDVLPDTCKHYVMIPGAEIFQTNINRALRKIQDGYDLVQSWLAEPIWTTATKAGLKAALYLWGRCDVPYDDVLPDTCEHYSMVIGAESFRANIDKALQKFQDGYDLVQVYTEHIDDIGHRIGPETENMEVAVQEFDEIILYLLNSLEELGLDDEVNIVIASDHGMANTSPGDITRTEMDDYLPAGAEGIESIADGGAFINIKVIDGYLDQVYTGLLSMPGVRVFKKEDIPEYFHIKEAKYLHDIVILTDIDNFILASRSEPQFPIRDDDYIYYGAHGYSPDEMKMKSIFFAHGPAFKKDLIIHPINIEDIYQVVMHAMNVQAQPNNGTWENVKDVFADRTTEFSEE